MQNDLKNIVESLLFVADNPIDIRTFKQVIPDADTKEIRQVLIELATEYETRQGGFLLSEVAGGFQFRTRPEYKEWIKKLVKPAPVRLSKAALETLAIIAYHQPIIRADVERIRGVDSGAILRGLLERKLIRILGKKDIPGRPLIYATTRRFLEIFNLKSLSDMPTLKEIQEFGQVGLAGEMTAHLADRQGETEAAEPAEQPETEASESDEAATVDQVDDMTGQEPNDQTDSLEAADTDNAKASAEAIMSEKDTEAMPEAAEPSESEQDMEASEAVDIDPQDQVDDNELGDKPPGEE